MDKNVILKSFEFNAQAGIIHIDSFKAFNQVNRGVLFKKLQSFGFSDSPLVWFCLFLSDRVEIVKNLNYKYIVYIYACLVALLTGVFDTIWA